MKQGQEITRDGLQDQSWIFLFLLKKYKYEVWEKNGEYLLFDPKERIVLATLEN